MNNRWIFTCVGCRKWSFRRSTTHYLIARGFYCGTLYEKQLPICKSCEQVINTTFEAQTQRELRDSKDDIPYDDYT